MWSLQTGLMALSVCNLIIRYGKPKRKEKCSKSIIHKIIDSRHGGDNQPITQYLLWALCSKPLLVAKVQSLKGNKSCDN